jgi:hypothetical protein
VSFRETIVPFDDHNEQQQQTSLPPPWGDIPGLQHARRGRVRILLEAQNVALTVRCFPLPVAGVNLFEQESSVLNAFDSFLGQAYYREFLTNSVQNRESQTMSAMATAGAVRNFVSLFVQQHNETATENIGGDLENSQVMERTWRGFLDSLSLPSSSLTGNNSNNNTYQTGIAQTVGCLPNEVSRVLAENVLSIGPKACPSNLLVFHNDVCIDVFDSLSDKDGNTTGTATGNATVNAKQSPMATVLLAKQRVVFFKLWQRLHSAVLAGFAEAIVAGPLMNEPMYGVGFCLERIELLKSIVDDVLLPEERATLFVATNSNSSASEFSTSPSGSGNDASIHTGQLISSVKEHFRIAMLSCPVRLVEAIYQCDLQCDQTQLGNLYAVLSRRRGTVFQEDIIEGTSMFLLSAYLPVAQSFQFAQELLKKTSGSGTAPQLSFSRWALMEQDPFWRPRTDDELEEFGEQFSDEHNLAKFWINKIRKRKGLAGDEQVVAAAEKQRTLSRKK